MMQKIFEPIFSVVYLILVFYWSYWMYKRSQPKTLGRTYADMAFFLGFGDAFHLIPRILALNSDTPLDYTVMLGFGKLVTSITMTVFYIYFYLTLRNEKLCCESKPIDRLVWVLAITRFLLILLPQNGWITENPSLLFGVLRNVPFVMLGILIMGILFLHYRSSNDKTSGLQALLVFLSYLFYIPVVLFASSVSWVGLLMIPKTVCYLVLVYTMKKEFTK